MQQANILVLEPFGGGSHKTFYQQWSQRSRHDFTVLELPAVHWKWRSRHAALSFAQQAKELLASGRYFDLVFCGSMLNVAEWRGLASHELARLPVVAYFHENQFTYPLAVGQKRDYHFAYNNVLTAISADQNWFNSQFHQDEFFSAAETWLRRMPDYPHLDSLAAAKNRSLVSPPGVQGPQTIAPLDSPRTPPTIGWVARWEHDKAPEVFVDAIAQLIERKIEFKLCLLGQRFKKTPACLSRLQSIAAKHITHDGYAATEAEYWSTLGTIDLVVSTAIHEFFGIGIIEAILAGAEPLLPNRLSYPEVLDTLGNPDRKNFLVDLPQTQHASTALAACIEQRLSTLGDQTAELSDLRSDLRARFAWTSLAARYDMLIDQTLAAAKS